MKVMVLAIMGESHAVCCDLETKELMLKQVKGSDIQPNCLYDLGQGSHDEQEWSHIGYWKVSDIIKLVFELPLSILSDLEQQHDVRLEEYDNLERVSVNGPNFNAFCPNRPKPVKGWAKPEHQVNPAIKPSTSLNPEIPTRVLVAKGVLVRIFQSPKHIQEVGIKSSSSKGIRIKAYNTSTAMSELDITRASFGEAAENFLRAIINDFIDTSKPGSANARGEQQDIQRELLALNERVTELVKETKAVRSAVEVQLGPLQQENSSLVRDVAAAQTKGEYAARSTRLKIVDELKRIGTILNDYREDANIEHYIQKVTELVTKNLEREGYNSETTQKIADVLKVSIESQFGEFIRWHDDLKQIRDELISLELIRIGR